MARILVIDDEAGVRSSLKSALERRGHDIVTAESLSEGEEFSTAGFDVIFLDVMLPDGNGLDLLKRLMARDPRQVVVMISGHADVDMAVDAIRSGAWDFIEKPVSLDRVLITLDNATRTSSLRSEKERLTIRVYGQLVGASPAINRLREAVLRAAPKANRFLILGENGTGKELVAHFIHQAGQFSEGPFVAVNCAALPSDLVESELFGHTAGAFTGASKARKGRFVEATGGSIFLDEISEMPATAQAKILRVVETRMVTPVGADKGVAAEGNIIAASNRDLESMVRDGLFREDLLYRLNVVTFRVPPLRERADDIALLSRHFLDRFAAETKTPPKQLTDGAQQALVSAPFPGNVRELKNLMERINIYCEDETVDRQTILPLLPSVRNDHDAPLGDAVAAFERTYINAAIARNNGNMTQAARELGIERSLLYKKLKRLEQ